MDSSSAASPRNTIQQFAETSAPVGGNATFIGTNHDLGDLTGGGPGWSKFRALVFADQAGTLNLRQSRDGVTWRTTRTIAVAASSAATILETLLVRRYVRMELVNGAVAQGTFEADSMLLAD